MRERPILFSGPMVRALLAGTKTQTRRIAKPVKHPDLGNLYDAGALVLEREPQHVIDRACPYGQPSDRLWVRETWAAFDADWRHPGKPADLRDGPWPNVAYAADGDFPLGAGRPSIHMPRWACRLVLEITGVRVERLLAISEADALAEGIDLDTLEDAQDRYDMVADYNMVGRPSAISAYRDLWESINGAGSWAINPWVWVVEFRAQAHPDHKDGGVA